MDLMNKTPKTIVAELDQFVIGQDQAKKSRCGCTIQPLSPDATQCKNATRNHA